MKSARKAILCGLCLSKPTEGEIWEGYARCDARCDWCGIDICPNAHVAAYNPIERTDFGWAIGIVDVQQGPSVCVAPGAAVDADTLEWLRESVEDAEDDRLLDVVERHGRKR